MTQTGEMTNVVSVGARRQRRPVIEQVARELCHPVDGIEQVEGHRIVELLETTPLAPVQPDPDAPEDATSSSAVPVSKVGRPSFHYLSKQCCTALCTPELACLASESCPLAENKPLSA